MAASRFFLLFQPERLNGENFLVSTEIPGFFDTIIVGAGPAGLSCAAACNLTGRRTLVLDKMDSCGRKLLITGTGQCNVTHAGEIGDFLRHYGSHGRFLKPALYSWTNQDLCRFFEDRGVSLTIESSGKVFPVSRSSKDILNVLIRECKEKGIEIRCGEPVDRVEKIDTRFLVTSSEKRYCSHYLVIATGGKSYPKTGSTGDGYHLAASLGHSVIPPAPALTPIIIREFPLSDLAGITFHGMEFSIWRESKKVCTCRGDVLITHTGFSGPGILDNSRSMLPGDEIRLSLTGIAPDIVAWDLMRRMQGRGSEKISALLTVYPIPARVLVRILQVAGISPDLTCAHLTAEQRTRLVAALTNMRFTIEDLGDFSIAMVTRGGVALPEVDPKTMESRLVKNLFFAGEVLDIDGDTGGYNLQAAFSTGRLAGTSIQKACCLSDPTK
jgi:predicted Rossmann fold flavoprotein